MTIRIEKRCGDSRGFSALEICVALIVLGVLTAGGATVISRYSSDGRVEYEAGKLIDHLWELRSDASTGMKNPCLDFPDSASVRLFRDMQQAPDGFGPGDKEILTYSFSGGVRALSIAGGTGKNHFVCFESTGVAGSAGAPLLISLGVNSARRKSIRLLPATGIASVQ